MRTNGMLMRPMLLALLAIVVISLLAHRVDAQPPEWELFQNEPNPFCGETTIGFAVPQFAEIQLAVLSPDSTALVRTLVQGLLNPGFYTILWDQTDEKGAKVPDGIYPYHLVARIPELTGILFEEWMAATVDCDVPVFPESWGGVKVRYRRESEH